MAIANVESGVQLDLTLNGKEGINIHRAALLRRATRVGLRTPALTRQRVGLYPPGTAELGLHVLAGGESLRILDSFGFPGKGKGFVDRLPRPESDELEGGPVILKEDRRILRIPLVDGAEFLFFYYAEAAPEARLGQWPLGLFPLKGSGPFPPLPPLPQPSPFPGDLPIPIGLPWGKPWIRHREWIKPRHLRSYIDSFRTVIDNGNPAKRFDIVITGDGFADTVKDLDLFDTRAQLVIDGFFGLNGQPGIDPFNDPAVSSLINVHVIRAVSAQSGVDNCPAGTGTKLTYYNVEGDFLNDGNPQFFGTQTPDVIEEALALVAPWEDVDLVIVLVNCDINGGSAFPNQRTAFVPVFSDLVRFLNVAAHESGHAVATLAEEYISGNVPDPLDVYPNQAKHADVQLGIVPWLALAQPKELKSPGDFKAVHELGDPFSSCDLAMMPPALDGMLGLYWGCQDVDSTTNVNVSGCPDYYQNPNGAKFYRPTQRCKMRKSSDGFCRVCAGKLAEIIALTAT
jgi:hypothetical protein